LVGAGVTYHLLHVDPGYQEKGVIAFVGSKSSTGLFADENSLLVAQELTDFYMQSAQAKAAVRAAGGSASYTVDLVNLSSQEFPNYGVPYVTVTVNSPSPAVTATTYAAVVHVLSNNLELEQSKSGARSNTLIRAIAASQPKGPIIQSGSHIRVLAGMALLVLILTVGIVSFLDRHRSWTVIARGRRPRDSYV
jgi:hypothetical protein